MPVLRQLIPVLHITNTGAAEAFYCNQLGFRIAFEVPASPTQRDPCYLGIVRDGLLLHLSSNAGDGVAGGVVFFLVDDVDALHEEFRSRNVRIHLAPIDQTWGLREMYVRDPDGNSIRFGCPVSAQRAANLSA
jgi:catechol 2,3-dioxygenase-like lactoylglutathione lyase family enzyme